MTEKSKLIYLRESTAQRMDLSSEEQDRIFSKIVFTFLESKEMDEVVETIGYMTTGGGQECLSKIVDELILKSEFGYAINAIKLIKSETERNGKYVHLIELKLINNDKSRIEFLKSKISNKSLLDYIEKIIDNPGNILKSEPIKIISSLEDNKQKLTDIIREVCRGYIANGKEKFDILYKATNKIEISYFHKCLHKSIAKSSNVIELMNLAKFLNSIDLKGVENIINAINNRIHIIQHPPASIKFKKKLKKKVKLSIPTKKQKKKLSLKSVGTVYSKTQGKIYKYNSFSL